MNAAVERISYSVLSIHQLDHLLTRDVVVDGGRTKNSGCLEIEGKVDRRWRFHHSLIEGSEGKPTNDRCLISFESVSLVSSIGFSDNEAVHLQFSKAY